MYDIDKKLWCCINWGLKAMFTYLACNFMKMENKKLRDRKVSNRPNNNNNNNNIINSFSILN